MKKQWFIIILTLILSAVLLSAAVGALLFGFGGLGGILNAFNDRPASASFTDAPLPAETAYIAPETPAPELDEQLSVTVVTGETEDESFLDKPRFIVSWPQRAALECSSFAEAARTARLNDDSVIYFRGGGVVWAYADKETRNAHIDGVPLISQFPELFRGCEVTSLAMLINFNGTEVDKLRLANEIAKDPTKRSFSDGYIFFGNPNDGFVGDMLNAQNNGLGVYSGPIFDLLKSYFPKTAVNMTGCEFSDVLRIVSRGYPVWVIVSSTFSKLSKTDFETWRTPSGIIEITYKEHSVVITGFDEENIYFNDPFGSFNSAPLPDFTAGWEQLGRQAVTVVNGT